MSEARKPSGLPGGPQRVLKNRLALALDRRPTAATAAEGFAAYFLGMLLTMSSVFLLIAGLVMSVEGAWGGWQGRAAGVGLMLLGAAAFAAGYWLMEQFSVQQGRRRGNS